MKITRIQAFQVDLPLHEGAYNWSGGKSVSVFDSTIVRVETDAGLTGHGEVCPLAPADANTGWLMHDALRVVRAVRDIDLYIEQPCLTYEQCLSVRRHTDHPFVLDESIDGIDVLLRAAADGAADVINIKISKLGGLTK